MNDHLSLEELKQLNDGDLAILSQKFAPAFDVLIARHLPLAKARAFTFLSENADIDDLIGEAAFGLLNAARTFKADGGAIFTTYAITCIDRKLLDFAKSVSRKKRFRVENRVDINECEIVDYSADPQAQIFQNAEISRILESAKTILSPLEFNVVMLIACGYAYSAIALNLKITAKSVDNALVRARKKLAQIAKIDKVS